MLWKRFISIGGGGNVVTFKVVSRCFSNNTIATTSKNREVTLKAVKNLQAYSKLNGGNTLVPGNFKVPLGNDIWPREMWGDNIGARIRTLRKHYRNSLLSEHDVALLEQHGMQWDVKPISINYIMTLSQGLQEYKANYGDTNVSLDFKIPSSSRMWSKKLSGISLGNRVQTVRTKYFQNRLEAEFVSILESAGIVWNAINSTTVLNLLEAIKTYKTLHPTITPSTRPSEYQDSEIWPEDFVNDSRIKKWLKPIRAEYSMNTLNAVEIKVLEAAGMKWVDPSMQYRHTWVSRLASGLRIYNKIYGTTLIPINFVVPTAASSAWPKDFSGDKLGVRLSLARKSYQNDALSKSDVVALESAGVTWVDPSAQYRSTWIQRLADGLLIYKRLYGSTVVPYRFVVPSSTDNLSWPREFHNEKLGARLARAGTSYRKNMLSKREAEILENAGVQWIKK